MAKYIGRRIVPTHGGVWDIEKEYEELTIVLNADTGDSYISRIPVPAGTAITDENYWMLYSLYSAQIAKAVAQMDAAVEEMEEEQKSMGARVTAAEQLSNDNKNTLNSRMDTIEAQVAANVSASTDADADYAAEVADARVASDGDTFASLGEAVRSAAETADHARSAECATNAGVELIGVDEEPYFTSNGNWLSVGLTDDKTKVIVEFDKNVFQGSSGQGFSVRCGTVSEFKGKKLFIRRDEEDGFAFRSVGVNFGKQYNVPYVTVTAYLDDMGEGVYSLDFDTVLAKADENEEIEYDDSTAVWIMVYGNTLWDLDTLGDSETVANSYQFFVEAEGGIVYDAATAREAEHAEASTTAGVKLIGVDSEPYYTPTGNWISVALSDEGNKVVVEFDNNVYQGSSGQGFSVEAGQVADFVGKKIVIRREEADGFPFRGVGISFGKEYNTPYVTATAYLTDIGGGYYSLDFDTILALAEENEDIEFTDSTSIWIMVFGTTLWNLTTFEDAETVTNSYQFFVEAEDGFVFCKGLLEKNAALEEQVEALSETCAALTSLTDSLAAGNVLWGKKWFATGDSFTSGGSVEDDKYFTDGPYKGKLKTYPLFIGIRNNMDVTNDGISGSTMALTKQYIAYRDGESEDVYAEDYKKPFSLTRYLAIPEDVDYITLWFGINDKNSTNLGTIDDETNETFYGAWNVVMEWILTNRPWAHVGIIITNGANEDYRNAEREIAHKWGIPYLDMMGDDQVPVMTLGREDSLGLCTTAYNLRRSTFSVGKTASGDSHPCWQAHEYESTFIEAFLRRL